MRTFLPLPTGQRPAVRVCAALLAAALFAICGLPRRAAASPSHGTSTADASGAESIAAATRSDAAPEAEQVVLYLARRSWHVDVGFAVRDLRPSLAFSARRFPQAKYLFFGFGDRHYLMSKHKGTSTLAGALLPGRGLILLTAIENSPAQAFGAPHVLEFALSAPQTAAAQRFVRRALAGGGGSSPSGEGGNPSGEGGNLRGENGNPSGEGGNPSGEGGNPSGERGNTRNDGGNDGEGRSDIPALADGPYEGSVYYSAVARYSALHTCNTWAAEVLKSAGLPVHTHFVLFAGQIWNQARKLTTQAIPRPTAVVPTAVAPTALASTAPLAPASRAPDGSGGTPKVLVRLPECPGGSATALRAPAALMAPTALLAPAARRGILAPAVLKLSRRAVNCRSGTRLSSSNPAVRRLWSSAGEAGSSC